MGSGANPFVELAVVLIVLFVFARVARPRRGIAAADDPSQPYSVFTKTFDVVCAGSELAALVAANPGASQIPAGTQAPSLEERKAIAERAYRSACELLAKNDLSVVPPPESTAIAFLVDQSGSMTNRMPELAGQLRAVAECLDSLGFQTALLGFTTVGWRGGRAREAWMQQGRPKRPGRLCALLHVIYKSFDQPLAAEDADGMLWADVLRENVDGEALVWASELLKQQSAAQRILLIVSDGAPVDDSTLTENGSNFLWRHLIEVVDEIEREHAVSLGAIGIDHSLESVFRSSIKVTGPVQLPHAVFGLIKDMLIPR